MWKNHPDIAKRWADEGKGYVVGKKKKNHPIIDSTRSTVDGRKHTRKVLKRYGFDYKTKHGA